MSRQLISLAALALVVGCSGSSYRDPSSAPAPAPAAASTGPSLFTRLGGLPAITAVVDAFVNRAAADTRINAFFRGVDAAQLKRLLVEQICAGTGGGCTYTGRDMRTTHRGMNLTNAHFDALVEDLVATLNQFNVPQAEQQELLGILGPMRRDIVGQ